MKNWKKYVSAKDFAKLMGLTPKDVTRSVHLAEIIPDAYGYFESEWVPLFTESSVFEFQRQKVFIEETKGGSFTFARMQKPVKHLWLWQMIEASGVVFREGKTEWEGTVTQLGELLRGRESKLTEQERLSVPHKSYLGQSLRKIERKWGANVATQRKSDSVRVWRLVRPVDGSGYGITRPQ